MSGFLLYLFVLYFVCVTVATSVFWFSQTTEDNEQAVTYDQLVRQLVSNEEKYITHLNLLLKVFQEPFTSRPDLFPPEVIFTSWFVCDT